VEEARARRSSRSDVGEQHRVILAIDPDGRVSSSRTRSDQSARTAETRGSPAPSRLMCISEVRARGAVRCATWAPTTTVVGRGRESFSEEGEIEREPRPAWQAARIPWARCLEVSAASPGESKKQDPLAAHTAEDREQKSERMTPGHPGRRSRSEMAPHIAPAFRGGAIRDPSHVPQSG